jgi:hypothetical protein
MPTRLADGLEAKKSSSDFSDTPRVLLRAKLWFPRVAIKSDFGDLVSISLSNRAIKNQENNSLPTHSV